MNSSIRLNPGILIKIGSYALILGLIYFLSFDWLVREDWAREDFNYAYMIPFVVLYLIWEQKKALLITPTRPSWTGMVPFLFGICLFWLGELAGEYFTIYFSFWLLVVGVCWLEMGWTKLHKIGFALIFMLTMFPPPNFIYTKISFYLKLISSKLGVDLIRLYGMTAFREGNIIDLGFTQLQVVDACSGLRYLIPLIVLALLLAYFFKAPLWKRAIVVLSAIPLSIATNSFRIAATGILYQAVGPEVAEGFFHGFSGWFIFMFSLGVLLGEMWLLGKIGASKKIEKENPEVKEDGVYSGGSRGRSFGKEFTKPHTMAALAILLITLGLSQGIEFREKIPVQKPLDGFPLTLGKWEGERQTMELRFVEELDLSDYMIIDYMNPEGEVVNFYVAYYESQRKGESIHSPETCLPGSGWVFNRAGKTLLPVSYRETGRMPVNRAFMQKGDTRQLTYYWFPQRGRILTNAYELKLYAFWDALTKQRTDGALVRVITPVYPLEDVDQAEERLIDFMKQALPVFDEFIPGSEVQKAKVDRN